MADYNFTDIERKWQKFWEENKTFKVKEDLSFPEDKRLYVLDMFPYPSGAGLHVGHPEGYTATDIISKYYRMNGYNILHPMGWDAFGLPAENYAIKTKTHPALTTKKNVDNFRRQIKMLGLGYDWSREVNTTHPDYYKWTQWIFLQFFNAGLAYKTEAPINFCPSCKTGLANEEVKDGKCDRCGEQVARVSLPQWMLKITEYADKLLEDLDELDWPEDVKTMQKNWIGKSVGAYIDFDMDGFDDKISVYTTRADTVYGVTYMVLAPEHPLVDKITTEDQKKEIEDYKTFAATKSDLERTSLNKDKTGAFTGSYAINPLNGEKIPVYISDYILISYGTGAIMAVPAHDQRDFDFAKKFGLEIKQVVANKKDQIEEKFDKALEANGYAVNSGEFDGTPTEEFKSKIIDYLEENCIGKKGTNYKLRDWIFSRQRYWGEPIPVVHCKTCGTVGVDEKDLPLTLPEVESYEPTDDGKSPLSKLDDWINTTCPKCGGKAKRETNTMPQWAGSCWYYLRYIDPRNEKAFCDKDKQNYWLPVGLYVGGKEHAVLHLLYARFWHKFLYDQGHVSTKEPFLKLRNQGMILGEDSVKMSKSRGNVINPDDIVKEFGVDAFRMYEMFMGPLERAKPWNTSSIKGIKKFIDKYYSCIKDKEIVDQPINDDELDSLMHKSIKKVGEDIETVSAFNTAISQLMILLKEMEKVEKLPRILAENFVKMISPFAPHSAEELWEILGHRDSIYDSSWPKYDEAKCIDDVITFVISVLGKKRGTVDLPKGTSEEKVLEEGLKIPNVQKFLEGKQIFKKIFVKDKLLNLIAK